MKTATYRSHTALEYEVPVLDTGRVEVKVPFQPGSYVTVFVIENPARQSDDLLYAAQSSLDFWDNPLDDEEWNHV